MTQFILINTVVVARQHPRPIFAGSVIDDKLYRIADIVSAGGQLLVVPNPAIEAQGAVARARRLGGARTRELDGLMAAAVATQAVLLVSAGAGPVGSIDGLHMFNPVVAPDSTVSFTAGSCLDSAATSFLISFNTLTVDLLTNGADGLDTGTVAADTWYAIFITGVPDRTEVPTSLASLSATAPLLPAPATIARRVGWVRTDGSSNIIKFDMPEIQTRSRWTYYTDEHLIQIAGTATAYTNTTVPASNFVPTTATRQQIGVLGRKDTGSGADALVAVIPDDWNEAGQAKWTTSVGLSAGQRIRSTGTQQMPVGPAQLIRYLVDDAEITVEVKGYEDEL